MIGPAEVERSRLRVELDQLVLPAGFEGPPPALTTGWWRLLSASAVLTAALGSMLAGAAILGAFDSMVGFGLFYVGFALGAPSMFVAFDALDVLGPTVRWLARARRPDVTVGCRGVRVGGRQVDWHDVQSWSHDDASFSIVPLAGPPLRTPDLRPDELRALTEVLRRRALGGPGSSTVPHALIALRARP